ncbi:hypothetical protein BaRGS_00016752 [Batillaria attramentaria]|uniref:Secreted protein n=1 Tax=Batillaria attramentaria TaxID=370345 RepID=A0ABD0KY50_9CAEN
MFAWQALSKSAPCLVRLWSRTMVTGIGRRDRWREVTLMTLHDSRSHCIVAASSAKSYQTPCLAENRDTRLKTDSNLAIFCPCLAWKDALVATLQFKLASPNLP